MVYGHCTTDEFLSRSNGLVFFNQYFSAFHMPLFFIVGGILIVYKNEVFSFPVTLIKKAKQLILPGLYFSLISIIIFTIIKLLSHNDAATFLKDSLLGLLALRFPDAMWFLPCYFFAEIIFLLLSKASIMKKYPIIICAVCFGIAILFLQFNVPKFAEVLAVLSRLMMAISFISFGSFIYQVLLSKWFSTKDSNGANGYFPISKRAKILMISGGVLLLAILVLGVRINGSAGCNTASYGKYPYLFLLNGIAGTMGLVFMFIALGKSTPVLEFFGKNTLIILCTHLLIINIFWLINSQFLHIQIEKINSALLAFCVVLIEVPIVIVINRFFPFLVVRKRKDKCET